MQKIGHWVFQESNYLKEVQQHLIKSAIFQDILNNLFENCVIGYR